MTTATLDERALNIATALKQLRHMPFDGIHVWPHNASLSVPSDYLGGFDAVREVCTWAKAFGTDVFISLSSGTFGEVETDVELGGELVGVRAHVGTALAYELGRVLQRPLSRDVSIQIGADELLAALDTEAVTA